MQRFTPDVTPDATYCQVRKRGYVHCNRCPRFSARVGSARCWAGSGFGCGAVWFATAVEASAVKNENQANRVWPRIGGGCSRTREQRVKLQTRKPVRDERGSGGHPSCYSHPPA